MLDTCRVTRASGAEMTDPITGEVTFPSVPVYPSAGEQGWCKVQTGRIQEFTPESAGRVVTVQRYLLHLPVGAGPVEVGDLVEILSAAWDPHLAGRRYRIVATHHKTLATAQRTEIEEVTR